jgi:hypothetical protein
LIGTQEGIANGVAGRGSQMADYAFGFNPPYSSFGSPFYFMDARLI